VASTACACWSSRTATAEGVRKTVFDAARFGLRRASPGDLAGGDAACNAKVVRSVAAGEPGPVLDAVLATPPARSPPATAPAAREPSMMLSRPAWT
jgi:anthranilate phosphoribosyltransferase